METRREYIEDCLQTLLLSWQKILDSSNYADNCSIQNREGRRTYSTFVAFYRYQNYNAIEKMGVAGYLDSCNPKNKTFIIKKKTI